ncbi:MAG TPA: MarR family transcriptional regulator [Drouetiella sp.]
MSSDRKQNNFGRKPGAQGSSGDARAPKDRSAKDRAPRDRSPDDRGAPKDRARERGEDCFADERHRHEGHHHRHERGPRGGFFSPHSDSPTENAMSCLMMTAKMIVKFGESRIAQNKKYSKLSGPRMGVLFIVHHSGGIRMGDLAGKLHVAPRTVTDLVDGLERDGFIHRIPDPKDRRASILELSERAKKDFDHIAEMRRTFIEEIFTPISDDEKQVLITILSKLREGPLRELLAQSMEESGEDKER